MPTKKRKFLFPFCTLVFGIVGGVLRAFDLTYCYDNVSGMYTNGALTYVLLALTAVFTILAVGMIIIKRPLWGDYTIVYRCGAPGAMLVTLCGVVLVLAGLTKIYGYFSGRMLISLFFGILTSLSGVSFVALAVARKRGELPYMTGFAAPVTVFWVCFMLISVFLEHPVEPMKMLFFYDLLAICFATMAVFCSGAQMYGRDYAGVSLFSSLMAAYFLVVSAVGRVGTFVITGSDAFVSPVGFRLAVYLALACFCLANVAALMKAQRPNVAIPDEI
jgi:hypothetical protein